MKIQTHLIRTPLTVALALACAASLQAEMTKYAGKPGSKVTVEGTSTVHDWKVEGGIISGFMELDSKIKIGAAPGDVAPGKVDAKVEAKIPVRSLKSYKDVMDNIMYDAMKQTNFASIEFKLKTLTLKAKPANAEDPWEFDAVGDLTVAGKAKEVTMPVKMDKAKDGKVRVLGTVSVKMTDFDITPPAPKVPGLNIKTGDEVKLAIDWRTAEAAAK
jgi:hypothetical protein